MDITLNEDQSLIARTALEFAQAVLQPQRIRELETTDDGYDRDAWRRMAEMGWAGAVFPEEYGGSGFSMLELGLIVEALGQGFVPSPLFSTVVEAGVLLLEAGSEEQRKRWLPRIASGEALATVALAEPAGGLLPSEIATRLTRRGAGFALSGTKLFVRDAGVAEVMVGVARSGSEPHDLTLVLIPGNAQRIARRRLRAAGGESLWEVRFDDVAIGADAVVGAPGAAWPHVERLLARGAAFKAAELAGIGQAALDLTLAYAKGRIQFGRPIGSFQGVQHHCVNMYRDLTVCRLLAWQALARLARGRPAGREAAMAKAKASEAIPALTRTAHQIHGAVAYYRDYPLELAYHRAMAAAATYGDAAHHRRSLGRLMRSDLARFQGDDRHELPVPNL